MSKLYPPIIAGTLPAFIKGEKITIPFQMNRAVGKNEFNGFHLKIKTVQNSRMIDMAVFSNEYDLDKNEVYFDSTNFPSLKIGQHYKAQIAFTREYPVAFAPVYEEEAVGNYYEVGYYSSVGVIKCTSKPEVKIEQLDLKKDNVHRYSYLGSYAQEGQSADTSEKLYSYNFNLYDNQDKLIYTSDWQIHNSTEDIEAGKSYCSFNLNRELEQDKKYYLEFEIITNNELHIKIGKYSLIQKKSISPNVDFIVIADDETAVNEGGISIKIKDNKDCVKNEILRTGSFKLMRADEETNFNEWNEILAFKLFDQEAPETLFIDYTVKQGVEYKYAIIQYNDYGLQSNKIYSNIVKSEFEDIYLFDGVRQLKVKYNPKISSFKEVILESKVDTIGNKHPFIFRNGKVEYKEFPISGLISTLMDDNLLFYKDQKKDNQPEHRVYNYNYKPITVKNEIIYYYLEEYFNLYCKRTDYTNGKDDRKYIPINEYFGFDKKKIIAGYVDDPNFYFRRVIEINEDGKREEKYKSLKELGQKISNTKYYYFEEIKDKLYIPTEKSYIKLPVGSAYDSGIKYYLSYVNTKNTNSLSPFSFVNNYESNSFQGERDFKLEVLSWLNNGKPKLFRSPTEGNYIIRLMNSSLSPNEQLGRMLHSFNSTAYEIDEYTFDNLKANGFLVVEDLTRKTIRWETIIFDKSGLVPNKINLLQYKAVALRFEGMIPGDKIFINDGIKRNGNTKPGYEVIIGATGSYNLDLGDNVKVTEVYFMSNSPDNIEDEDKRAQHQGQLTYAFESAAFSSFDTIKEFSLDSTPIHQFYGRYDNILNKINNIKNQLQEVYFIHAVLREEKNVFGHNPQYKTKLDPITNEAILDEEGNPVLELEKFLLFSTDAEGKYPIELNDRTATYRIYDSEADIYRYYDGYNFKYLDLTEKDIENGDKLILNDSTAIQVFNDNDFFLKETEEITSITTGYRILLEICYQVTTTVYGAEDRKYGVPKVIAKLNEYDQAKVYYNYLLKMGISNRETIYNAQERMEKIYGEFIEILIETLKEQEAIEGELV